LIVDFYLDQQVIDTTTPAGRMFVHVTEASRSRVNAGPAKTSAKGPRSWRGGET
jgi:hypothetical protein